MKMSGYASVALACLLVCFKSAYAGSSNSSSYFSLSDNPEITCPGYANCSSDSCNFNGTINSNTTSGYFAGTEVVLHCGVIALDVHSPPSKDKMPVGSSNTFCYNYTNSNNTGFDAMQVVIKKANNSDMNATTAVATIANSASYVVTMNETADVVMIVVLPASGCTPYVPPSTEAPTTTTSASTSTSTGQPSSTSASSSNTTSSDSTTAGSGTVPPTSAPTTSNATGGPTTTPSSGIKVEPTILLAFVAISLFFLQV